MEGNTQLPKENLIILCLLRKNTLISVEFACQVNHSLDPELEVCDCLNFLITSTIKPATALWIKFYFRYMREDLWNLKVHLLMDPHQIIHVSLLWRCVCNFSWNGQNFSEFTLQWNGKSCCPRWSLASETAAENAPVPLMEPSTCGSWPCSPGRIFLLRDESQSCGVRGLRETTQLLINENNCKWVVNCY